jgi:hypothetical protein
MTYVPQSDGEDFLYIVRGLAKKEHDPIEGYFSRIESQVMALRETCRPQVNVTDSCVCKHSFMLEDGEGVRAFNEDLVNNWELAATSKDGTARLYVDEHDSDGLSLRCVSDIGAAMLGQVVFSGTGSQRVDGAYLTSVGMFPSVIDISTPAHSRRGFLVEQVRVVINEYGMDDMLPMLNLSSGAAASVAACISPDPRSPPSPVESAAPHKAPEM